MSSTASTGPVAASPTWSPSAGAGSTPTSVVVGVGAVPDVRLSRTAGLEIGELGGVVVDSRLQTAVPGIFAAGDIAEYESVVHGGRTHADRALGRRVQPGQDRGAQHARQRPASRRRAVLLLRSLGLGFARVRRSRRRMGAGGRSRLDRRRRVHDLLPPGRPRRGGSGRRPLRRSRARRSAAERRRRRARSRARARRTSRPTWARSIRPSTRSPARATGRPGR